MPRLEVVQGSSAAAVPAKDIDRPNLELTPFQATIAFLRGALVATVCVVSVVFGGSIGLLLSEHPWTEDPAVLLRRQKGEQLRSGTMSQIDRVNAVKQEAARVAIKTLSPELKAMLDARPGEVVRLENGDEWIKHPGPGGTYEMVGHEARDPKLMQLEQEADELFRFDINNNRRDAWIASRLGQAAR